MGKGLYTAALSNKRMAAEYGQVRFVVNAVPKKPLVLRGLNDWEIFRYELIINFGKQNNIDGDYYEIRRVFNDKTSIESEVQKMGYDGVIIKGREMVNYTPPSNVLYFKTEDQVFDYWLEVINVDFYKKLYIYYKNRYEKNIQS